MSKLLIFLALWTTVGIEEAPAPKPAIAPKTWELKFRFQDPRKVSVFVPGSEAPVVYWYMLYSVENPGRQERDFLPQFDVVTDTLATVRSELKVSPEAYRAIERRANDPLLVPPEKAVGRLLSGKENSVRSVAIWRDFDPKAKAFTVFVGGLSGETAAMKNPAFDESKPEGEDNPRKFVLRKTLAIPYRLPGSEEARSLAEPERVPDGMEWIMR